jgi:cytochrome P450
MPGADLVGHVGQFRRDHVAFLQRMADAGDIARIRFVAWSAVLITSPELIQEVLVEHARSFEKASAPRYLLYPLGGEGLFTSRGELWRRQRRLMAPLFQSASQARYAECMVDCAAT